MKPTSRHGTGQTGEYLVAAELARHGFSVALPTGNAEAVDILAYGFGETLAVQVKTAGRGNHQFNLGKFVHVDFQEDGTQTVVGRRGNLDANILIVFVFLGAAIGEDEFAWGTLGEFADFLGDAHQKYLDKNGGRRPGKNPRSLHASLTKAALQERFTNSNVMDFLKSIRNVA